MSNKIVEKLKEITKNSPKSPGVYFWLDENGKSIYIGRANNLKQRLNQYWQKNLDSKSQEMVKNAYNLKYIETETILESIILEAANIKKYWPLYNIRDRDNRSFIYIIIDKNKFPKINLIRERQLNKLNKDDFYIYGPYQSYRLINTALKLIRKIFPYSLCQPDSGKPCFDRQIGLCPGVCVSEISSAEYKKNIRNIKLLLSGQKDKLIEKLKKDNPEKIKSLAHIQEVSLLQKEDDLKDFAFKRIEAYDISHWQGKNPYGAMVVMENGKIKNSDYRLFKIKQENNKNDEASLLEVLSRRLSHHEWNYPDLIVIDGGFPQVYFLERNLKEINTNISIVGLSKYQKDKLVFAKNLSDDIKKTIKKNKEQLITLRDEAHRFSNYGRKRSLKRLD